MKRDQQKIQYSGERTPSQQSASKLNRLESPHFNPQLIFPSSPQSPEAPSYDMEIPKSRGTPVDIAPTVLQNTEVQTPELDAALTIHRQRVTTRERNALLSRNQAFEANIGRRARGCADGKCNDSNNPTQPSVVYNGN